MTSKTSTSGKLSSMTGFARLDGALGDQQWVWECRSVNGRGLEVRVRTPQGFDGLEQLIRKETSLHLKRGSVNISLNLTQSKSEAGIKLNQQALSDVMAIITKMRDEDKTLPAPTPEGILNIRGVIETADYELAEEERAQLHDAIIKNYKEALALLIEAREKEGAALADIVQGQLLEIERLTQLIRANASETVRLLRKKIDGQLKELLADHDVSDERLAGEVALLAVKADIVEELDRLEAHSIAGTELLTGGGPVGRQFDFLVQEFNREANTLCSKAVDISTKKLGLEMKSVIDQMREQIQNVE